MEAGAVEMNRFWGSGVVTKVKKSPCFQLAPLCIHKIHYA